MEMEWIDVRYMGYGKKKIQVAGSACVCVCVCGCHHMITLPMRCPCVCMCVRGERNWIGALGFRGDLDRGWYVWGAGGHGKNKNPTGWLCVHARAC